MIRLAIKAALIMGLFGVSAAANSVVDKVYDKIYSNFSFLPQYHTEADLYTFFLKRNDFFKQRYFLQADPRLSFTLVSFQEMLESVWEFEFEFGMGQTPGNVVFDPMDVNFGIIPLVQFNAKEVIVRAGLDHRCFHEIDRKDFQTVYWNQPVIAVASQNHRQSTFRNNLLDQWTQKNRISWSIQGGYYLKDFFGLVSPGKLNGLNDRIYDITTDLRYAFFKRRSWIFNGRLESKIGQYDSGKSYPLFYKHELSLESNLRTGLRGGMLFVKVIFDDLPEYDGFARFSKNELLMVGLSFFD